MHQLFGGWRQVKCGDNVRCIWQLQFHRLTGDTFLLVHNQPALTLPPFLCAAWRKKKQQDSVRQSICINKRHMKPDDQDTCPQYITWGKGGGSTHRVNKHTLSWNNGSYKKLGKNMPFKISQTLVWCLSAGRLWHLPRPGTAVMSSGSRAKASSSLWTRVVCSPPETAEELAAACRGTVSSAFAAPADGAALSASADTHNDPSVVSFVIWVTGNRANWNKNTTLLLTMGSTGIDLPGHLIRQNSFKQLQKQEHFCPTTKQQSGIWNNKQPPHCLQVSRNALNRSGETKRVLNVILLTIYLTFFLSVLFFSPPFCNQTIKMSKVAVCHILWMYSKQFKQGTLLHKTKKWGKNAWTNLLVCQQLSFPLQHLVPEEPLA